MRRECDRSQRKTRPGGGGAPFWAAYAAAALFATTPVLADAPVDCNRAGTTAEFEACAVRDYAHADAELNRVYRQARAAMRRLPPDASVADRRPDIMLRDAQRAWIAFRDDACAVEAMRQAGGASARLATMRCKERLTTRRVLDLRLLVDGAD